ncbi:phosphate transporter PHO1 homolog 3 isoform X1 [Cannabis sativa]|uniref:phosphate transporter PHO1 homolog 3 isoform X1 n=1 Tax=Cannabis sativa TaxID=3483 RepID=UPI0029C9C89D|nr:phosphate transporter PHO1 homolog 3 isoform X1 [Cannabis sativa]
MKFGKEFASQMVPEWQEAYMDYKFLKEVLKEILRFRQRTSTVETATTPRGSLSRKVSLYRAFSGLTNRYRSNTLKLDEDQVILVNPVHQQHQQQQQQQQQGSESEFEELELEYQTMFMMSTDDGGEYEVVFFKRLDDEFNKVVNFYRKKVKQVLEEADELTRQMNVLIALRIKVENPVFKFGEDDVMNIASKGVSLSDHPQPLNDQKPERQHMDAIQEVERSCEGLMDEEEDDEEEGRISNESKGSSGSKESNEKKEHKKGVKGFRPASLDVLHNVKINVAPETPISTLRGILMTSTSDFSFSKEELKKSEELMKQAFIEFYQKLKLLKSYCFMNQLAFSKIMKKYDKISTRSAAKAYLEMVDESYLGSSDEVSKLMERVEATFIKHFANGNRAKGMNTLRPKTKRERHRTTFLLGFLSGCSVALVVTIIVLVQIRNLRKSEYSGQYMDNIFPLYSLFGFIVLHMLMFSANIYFWRKYRVNYPFIFGLKQGTDLGYRQVFLLSAGLSVLSLGAVISNLDMKIDPKTRSFDLLSELVPMGLVVALLVMLVLPFNILYRSTRYFLIVSGFHCLFAPLYKVSLPDFFLADQLTSQVQAFRSLVFYVCYYFWGDFTKRQHKCLGNDVYKAFNLVVAIIPYWFRLLQCIRRLLEEKDGMQGLNGLKYFSTIIAVSMRILFDSKKDPLIKFLVISSSLIATIAGTYWDLVIDWGLLRRDSKNPWLRDKLILQQKSVYFVAMVVNVALRLAWLQTVLQFQIASLHPKALIAIVASLEIIRRGIWNFFRIENEHLNNVGKYRAFKSVPLPFNYDDENDEKEE